MICQNLKEGFGMKKVLVLLYIILFAIGILLVGSVLIWGP